MENSTLLHALVHNAVDGIITINAIGTVESINPSACALFGYHQEELIGKNISILMPSPNKEMQDNYLHTYTNKSEIQHSFYSKTLADFDEMLSLNKGLEELKEMIAKRKRRSFKRKHVIYFEGDRATGAYLVLSGKIKTVKMNADGRELMTGMYEPDEFLGINAILYNDTYTDSATVLENCELCFFPKEQLEELLRLYPDVACKFLKILSAEIRDKDAHLLDIAYQSVRKRIAESILRVFRHNNEAVGAVSISRDDLASMSGTASETVSRTLTEFKNEGLIQRKGSHITILDYGKISSMKN